MEPLPRDFTTIARAVLTLIPNGEQSAFIDWCHRTVQPNYVNAAYDLFQMLDKWENERQSLFSTPETDPALVVAEGL